MRSRLAPLVLGALLAFTPLASAVAQEDEPGDEYAAEEAGGDAEEFAEPERLATAAEDLGAIGFAFTTLTGFADLMILRPIAIGLGAVSGLTYGFAVGPTALTNPDGMDELRQSLLVDPWLFAFTRPLGGDLDSRSGARPADDDTVF